MKHTSKDLTKVHRCLLTREILQIDVEIAAEEMRIRAIGCLMSSEGSRLMRRRDELVDEIIRRCQIADESPKAKISGKPKRGH